MMQDAGVLLIEPEGIETDISAFFLCSSKILLIEPEGIETPIQLLTNDEHFSY